MREPLPAEVGGFFVGVKDQAVAIMAALPRSLLEK
jgi:hypothetical protein